MKIRLNHHSGEPIWKQVVEQVKYLTASGELSPGAKLPSIRALANELAINPRTVVKAYDELKHLGLVVMRQGQGVFIEEVEKETPLHVRRQVIEDLGRRLLSEANRLGADADEVIEILNEIANEMEAE